MKFAQLINESNSQILYHRSEHKFINNKEFIILKNTKWNIDKIYKNNNLNLDKLHVNINGIDLSSIEIPKFKIELVIE